jgi:hypothetical protein
MIRTNTQQEPLSFSYYFDRSNLSFVPEKYMRKSHFDVKRGVANKLTIERFIMADKRDRTQCGLLHRLPYILEIETELDVD